MRTGICISFQSQAERTHTLEALGTKGEASNDYLKEWRTMGVASSSGAKFEFQGPSSSQLPGPSSPSASCFLTSSYGSRLAV